MMPDLNDLMAPDMQKVILFMVPALIAITALVMAMSRGFSTVALTTIVLFTAIALYFAPGFLELF